MTLRKIAGLGALLSLALPGVALAAEEPVLNSGDTAWMLISTALVLLMTIPGLALFYGGMVRAKNVLSIMMQCFAITGLITILWVVYGYSLAFDTAGMEKGVLNFNSFVGGLDKAFLSGLTADGLTSATALFPESVFITFQMTFAIITPALIVGAFAEKHAVIALLADTVGQALVHQQAGHPCRPAEVADRATQQRHEGFLAQLEALQPRVWQQAFLVAFQAQVKALQLRVQVAAEQVGIDPAADQQGAGAEGLAAAFEGFAELLVEAVHLAGRGGGQPLALAEARTLLGEIEAQHLAGQQQTDLLEQGLAFQRHAGGDHLVDRLGVGAGAAEQVQQRPRLGGEGQQAALGLVAVVQRLDAELVAQQGQLPGLRVPAGEGVHAVRQYPALQAVEQQADLAMDFAAGLVDLAVVGDPPLALLRRQRYRRGAGHRQAGHADGAVRQGRDALAERAAMGQQA